MTKRHRDVFAHVLSSTKESLKHPARAGDEGPGRGRGRARENVPVCVAVLTRGGRDETWRGARER